MNDNDVEEQLPYLLFRRSLSIFLTLRNVLCKVRMVAPFLDRQHSWYLIYSLSSRNQCSSRRPVDVPSPGII